MLLFFKNKLNAEIADDVNLDMNGGGGEEVDFAEISQARTFEILKVRMWAWLWRKL